MEGSLIEVDRAGKEINDAIKSDDYVQFLREDEYVVRRYICNQNMLQSISQRK